MPKQDRVASVTSSPKSVNTLALLNCSPALIIAAVVICDFFSHLFATAALSHFNMLDHPLYHIFESLLLLVILLPALIILVSRPVQLHLAQRRRAEEELAAERNKLWEILDAIPAAVFIVDRFHKIGYMNRALLKEFGPLEGRLCHDYFQRRQQACQDCPIDEVLGGKSMTCEFRSVRTGDIYEVFETPLHNGDDTISKLAMLVNVTARRAAEQELQASRQQLRSLSTNLQRVREEERTAVSREIHDELGQVLATVQLGVSSLAEEYAGHEQMTDKFAGMGQLLSRAIRTVQKISAQLRPAILDELGLAEAIEWQAAEFRERTGIDCTPDILLSETNFNRDVATAVFRIFQEALTNVIRHSEATRVAVSLEERNGRIILIIADNGCGIAHDKLRDRRSLGITGMRERAYALGGRVRICRWLPQGTAVIAHIPVEAPGREGGGAA